MGGFSNFALSFSIISILTGAVTLYGDGLRNGGPLVMGVGWPLVTLMTLPVAASLAELASAFPTAGALYHWSAILGGRGWGYLTGWLNLLGQVAVTAGVDYGFATFAADLLGLGAAPSTRLGLYAAVLASHALLNHLGVKAVKLLNSLSAWYHLAGVAVLVGILAMRAPLQPAGFLLHRFTAQPRGLLYGFLIGLLQAQWTYTGYDASAHSCEETRDPRRNAPWGMVLSVAISGVAGFALLAVVTLAISDIGAAAGAENPFVFILAAALGPQLGAAMVWLAVIAMWFCGLASVTSNSRMLFALARDGGVPGSQLLARVSPTTQSPAAAVWVSVLAAFAVAVWSGAYTAVVALSTIALYASYGLPIALGLRARRSGRWSSRGPWNLGRASSVVNAVALGWVAGVMVLFVLPPNQLAGFTFAGCLAALGAAWLLRERRTFRGPPLPASWTLAPEVVPPRPR